MFQFTHPGRGATGHLSASLSLAYCFNSRTPGGVRPQANDPRRGSVNVSIHAPREGCDVAKMTLTEIQREFQFTHPGRGATRGGGRSKVASGVSIHAPREGCDKRVSAFIVVTLIVSIHAPREGCDILRFVKVATMLMFQFTHPGRGATLTPLTAMARKKTFQFTHPGRGATSGLTLPMDDPFWFQFTHPGRGATCISISEILLNLSFNSRTPGGVRQSMHLSLWRCSPFQFTHPGRGATRPRSHERRPS